MSGMDGMDSMDSDEELFFTQNSFSQEILQPNFSIDSLLDAIEGSGEPAPQNSCAEELKKLVVTWCLRTYIGLRPYMVNVYIKERINDQTTICAGGSPVTPRT